ncbi:MAG: transposase [Candidatus Methanosuratus sp.]|nr:transposase [Candidatus Methanosuratincola sp.]
MAERLVDEATARAEVKEVIGDGAYDTARLYEHLRNRGIDAVIKPRRNSVLETPSRARRYEVDLYRNLGHGKWAAIKGYGRRWSVETAYSTFKRVFGESVMARTLDNVVRELAAKVSLYNILVRI